MKLPLSAPRFGLAVIALVAGASALIAWIAASPSPSSSDPRPVSQTQSSSASDDSPGDISGPCNEAEHANDPRCVGTGAAQPDAPGTTSTTAPAGTPPTPAPSSGDRVVEAGGGTVTYRAADGQFQLISATPAASWSVEIEQSAGREIEVDFRSGTRRVQVNIELEDGEVRERVRARDAADDSEVRIENGVVTHQESGDDHRGDDHGGHNGTGSGSSGSSGSSGPG